ncbi:hypothetical protein LCGC14_2669880, partial [marine sediment metagenome]
THASYVATTNNVIEIGTPTEVEMSLLDLADTAAVQSTKADLGVVRARRYVVTCCLEYQVAAPTTGTLVEFYWAASGQSGAAVGNPGYATGADGAYTGTPATLAEGIDQLQFIGILVVSADIEFQIADIGEFSPAHRYGSLIVKNESGQTIADTDIVESAVVMTPIVDDIAAAS